MSSFLWVEDFDDGRYRQVAFEHFGDAFKLLPEQFPDDLPTLVRFLKERGVTLATTYAEGRRVIDGQLNDIDFVVLDIDLALVGEDPEEDHPLVLPELESWYDYHPQSPDEEASYDSARTRMKRVAGYHLWTHLIINKGFPRSRIQFCSQHGDHLNSIEQSFKPAMIVAPEIFRKADGRIGPWVAGSYCHEYVSLRRNVIDYCDAVTNYLETYSGSPKVVLRLSGLPGKTTSDFGIDQALELLEGLPRNLPRRVDDGQDIRKVLHAFVRAMTIEWDRHSADPAQREEFEKNQGKTYKKAFDEQIRSAASVLKFVRNTLSHGSGSSVQFECQDVGLLFLLNMDTMLNLESMDAHQRYENKFLNLNSDTELPPSKDLLQRLERSKETIEALAIKVGVSALGGTGDCLRKLQAASSPEFAPGVKWFFRMLWHEMFWNLENPSAFEAKLSAVRNREADLVRRVARESFSRAFF